MVDATGHLNSLVRVISRTLLMKESARSRLFHPQWPATTGFGWDAFFLMKEPRFSTIFIAWQMCAAYETGQQIHQRAPLHYFHACQAKQGDALPQILKQDLRFVLRMEVVGARATVPSSLRRLPLPTLVINVTK
jgi:hypothetical protein